LFIFGFILGLVAVSQGATARKNLKSIGAPTGNATAGIVLGFIGVIGWIAAMIWFWI